MFKVLDKVNWEGLEIGEVAFYGTVSIDFPDYLVGFIICKTEKNTAFWLSEVLDSFVSNFIGEYDKPGEIFDYYKLPEEVQQLFYVQEVI